jgi:hypothetical protein
MSRQNWYAVNGSYGGQHTLLRLVGMYVQILGDPIYGYYL